MNTLLLVDLDGTIINTPHYEAWSSATQKLISKKLTHIQYLSYVAGRPRLEGSSNILTLLTPQRDRLKIIQEKIGVLAELKQQEFLKLADDTRLYEDAERLLARTYMTSQPIIFYTASQNASELLNIALKKTGLYPYYKTTPTIIQRTGESRADMFRCIIQTKNPTYAYLIDDSTYAIDEASTMKISTFHLKRHVYQPSCAHPRATVISTLDEFPLPLKA